jgi:hypothetical protein
MASVRYAWLVLAACGTTNATTPSSVFTTAPALDAIAAVGPDVKLVWRNPGLYPIGQPIAVADVAVGIVSDHRELFAVGLDPARGTKLWQHQLTPSAVRPSEPVDLTKIGSDRIAYLRPTRDADSLVPYAQLVIADARTGRDLATSPETLFTTQPFRCHGGDSACVITEEWGRTARAAARLDGATGAWIVEPAVLPVRTRAMSDDGLVDLGNRPDETYARLVDGKLRWRLQAATAFPGPFSSDWGWTWHHDADAHVYVGSLYGEPETRNDRYVYDLAATATAGIAEATGEVLWRDRGSHLIHLDADDTVPLRYRARGEQSFRDRIATFRGLDVVLERFDPVSGQTIWRLELGDAPAIANGSARPAIAGPSHVMVATTAGPIVLDYVAGTTTPAPADRAFWCVARARYELLPEPWTPSRSWQGYKRPGGQLAFPCDTQGAPVSTLPDAAATLATGARIGPFAVIATHDAFYGFAAR